MEPKLVERYKHVQALADRGATEGERAATHRRHGNLGGYRFASHALGASRRATCVDDVCNSLCRRRWQQETFRSRLDEGFETWQGCFSAIHEPDGI